MITPRRTRLVRVHDLHSFRRVIRLLCGTTDVEAPYVIVPSRSAARQLQRGLGGIPANPVTRDQLYDSLSERLASPAGRLTPFERDSLFQAAAADAAGETPGLSFRIRPGLVAEMLRFYDQLRRQSQLVDRFEELMLEAIGARVDEPSSGDKGVDRLRLQTRFLASAFRSYERRVSVCGACDEHGLRERLLAEPAPSPIRHVVVTIADWIADPDGLYAADFELLSRVPGLEALDIVTTAATLGSGFHERLRDWWPGIEEVEGSIITGALEPVRPALLTPDSEAGRQEADQLWFTFRDREEELVAAARRIQASRQASGSSGSRGCDAVVYKHPLPYLYLAPAAFKPFDMPYVASDALPLAAEPAAAALDLVLDVVETNFVRSALVALLRSPHFGFLRGPGLRPFDFLTASGSSRELAQAIPSWSRDERAARAGALPFAAISALDRALSESRYLGERSRLESLAAEWAEIDCSVDKGSASPSSAMPALAAALQVARDLTPLQAPAPASRQLELLLDFMGRYWQPTQPIDPCSSADIEARERIANILSSLAAAHRTHHDPLWTIDDLATAVRRWIGDETFAPAAAGAGVHLLDDQAARYGIFETLSIVGLVEQDWPDRTKPNIFYPSRMLKSLGWPSEKDRRAAADARFVDLLGSSSRTVSVSTFMLDEDALVMRSPMLDEIARARLPATPVAAEAGSSDSGDSASAASAPTPWLALRKERPAADTPAFHGFVGSQTPRTWTVSALETYLGCPFRFFALHVLKLKEEPEDEEVLDPRRQGALVHTVFESFFREWQTEGRGAITSENLDEARARFEEIVNAVLSGLPAAEAGLERTRLLGSPAAAGLGEAVFRMEAERPVPVVERLLEHTLAGTFSLNTSAGPREVSLRGKADRLDLLQDGTFRLIDYKLGWPPNRSRALQLPIYGVCAEQRLEAYRGRSWKLGEAAYLAFKGPRRVVPLFASPSDRDAALADAQNRLAETIDAINRGEFPPTPDDVYRCETCTVTAVCRKEYVGDVRT